MGVVRYIFWLLVSVLVAAVILWAGSTVLFIIYLFVV